ncbi:hypothetical protein [Wolbachia endosymbiont of Chironomus riparius]|uniref:hypothetical protein n=1 Tax=Wolbachia endosymbiont of Chironomus riparius TaxID=2883238 RepID=UPI00209D0E44|nr:hypothetical protein [Wolbachia endosymbiont of Chironomus riparius]
MKRIFVLLILLYSNISFAFTDASISKKKINTTTIKKSKNLTTFISKQKFPSYAKKMEKICTNKTAYLTFQDYERRMHLMLNLKIKKKKSLIFMLVLI